MHLAAKKNKTSKMKLNVINDDRSKKYIICFVVC